MKHIIADLTKLKLINGLYHRTYHTHPMPTLLVTVDGERREYKVRWRAASTDKLYHSTGIKCVLITYDDIVLAYEVLKDDMYSTINNMSDLLNRQDIMRDTWYFDTEKFYRLDAKPSADFLSIGQMSVLDPIHFTYSSTVSVMDQDCFVICKDNEILIQTPPVSTSVKRKDKQYMFTNFEQDTQFLSVTQLLKLCSSVSKIFGTEEIERFDLPSYMIRHKTVNLGKLPVYVRDNSTTSVKPAEAITYLIGLLNRIDDHNDAVEIQKQIKSIARFGSINAKHYDDEHVYTGTPVEIIEYNY